MKTQHRIYTITHPVDAPAYHDNPEIAGEFSSIDAARESLDAAWQARGDRRVALEPLEIGGNFALFVTGAHFANVTTIVDLHTLTVVRTEEE